MEIPYIFILLFDSFSFKFSLIYIKMKVNYIYNQLFTHTT